MTPEQILRRGFHQMHNLLDKAVGSMTAEQFNFRPAEGGVSAFFSLWHYVRTEDNIIQWVIEQRPTVWLEGGYDQRLGLHRTSQGTGMTAEQANAVQVHDVPTWLEYQQKVWEATDDYLRRLPEDGLVTRRIVIKPAPEMSLWDGLFGMCLSHGYRHCGEIEYVRGVQGIGGLTI
jgi:hypothetical protein